MKYILLSALLLATVLVSGRIDIGFQHHLNLPEEVTKPNDIKVSHFLSNKCLGFVCTKYDIFLKDSLMTHRSINDVQIKVFNNAGKGDKIYFHLAGFGGSVDVYVRLIDLVNATKAETIMLVEGPVYSGHAYLSLAGNQVVVYPYAFLMFHTYSTYGTDCSKQEGADRTIPNSDHCERATEVMNWLISKMITNTPLLTPQERVDVLTGHSVFITYDQIRSRVFSTSEVLWMKVK